MEMLKLMALPVLVYSINDSVYSCLWNTVLFVHNIYLIQFGFSEA